MYHSLHQNCNPLLRFSFHLKQLPVPLSDKLSPPLKWESQANNLNTLCKRHLPNGELPNANAQSYACLLQSCTNIRSLNQLHARLLITGFNNDAYLDTKLVSMYAKCGSLEYARLVFDRMYERNVLSWNALIRGYSRKEPCLEALALYHQMQGRNIVPDKFTFSFVLKACARLAALQDGKEIHHQIVRAGFESDVFVGTALIDMYIKCWSVEDARRVFDKMSRRDVVTWTAMISGYAQNGHAHEALTLFNQMLLEEVTPDSFTMVSVLQACGALRALKQGEWIHEYIIRSEYILDDFVWTALIDMYAKCGNLEIARQLFHKMSQQNVVSWSAMIAGYAQNGHANEALALFRQMQLADVKPDSVTMVCLLQACTCLGDLKRGKAVHGYIIRRDFATVVSVGTSLIDMYAKCKNIDSAGRLFGKMVDRNVVSWNAIIGAYTQNGLANVALSFFHQMRLAEVTPDVATMMQQTDMKPDHITFICVLSACSHAGLVDEGWQYFDCMNRDYCITPAVKHYACMVDLLGRAGHLQEAYNFIQKMPLEPDASVWGALLGACRIHCNIELGEQVAETLLDLEPENPVYYVLLSNIYAGAGRWDAVAKVRTLMEGKGLKKTAGCSLIEMEEAGHAPNMNFVLHNVEEEVSTEYYVSHDETPAFDESEYILCAGHCFWSYNHRPWDSYPNRKGPLCVVNARVPLHSSPTLPGKSIEPYLGKCEKGQVVFRG
eukprot:Gb_09416 [translate_table: standard]